MADAWNSADAARAMRTMTRHEQADAGSRRRFGRHDTTDEALDERVETLGYTIDTDAVAAAIVDRLLAGRTLRPRADDA
jgi:hypothetical protein